MAPIKEDTVDALKDLVHKLESRVEQLEAKLQNAEGGPVAPRSKSNTDSIRIVLMGPPGAGMISPNAPRVQFLSNPWTCRLISSPQGRVPKHRGSRRNTAPAIL